MSRWLHESLSHEARHLLKAGSGAGAGTGAGAYSTGGASGGTSSSGNSSRGAFNWRALVIALSATFGLVLLIILLWWINRRYKAKHGRSLWARRSSRVVDENQEDAGAPPPPPPVDITKIPGVIVLSAYPPPDGPPHAEKGIAAGGESAAGLGAAETPAALVSVVRSSHTQAVPRNNSSSSSSSSGRSGMENAAGDAGASATAAAAATAATAAIAPHK